MNIHRCRKTIQARKSFHAASVNHITDVASPRPRHPTLGRKMYAPWEICGLSHGVYAASTDANAPYSWGASSSIGNISKRVRRTAFAESGWRYPGTKMEDKQRMRKTYARMAPGWHRDVLAAPLLWSSLR